MAQPMEPVLVIDDDRDLCDLLAEYFKPEGFAVETAWDGRTGIKKAMTGKHSIVVLDVMLPGGQDGFAVLRQIRAHADVPVLMLTARGDDIDRIIGLELGADDYLSKPFNPRELLARIRAVLRRFNVPARESSRVASSVRYRVGDVELDTGTRTVNRAGRPVDLTSVEFSLLEVLLLHAGRTVTREDLTTTVLGRHLTPYDRSIDVHVSKLRKKLGQGPGPVERIRSIRGVGYMYALPVSSGHDPAAPHEKGGERDGARVEE